MNTVLLISFDKFLWKIITFLIVIVSTIDLIKLKERDLMGIKVDCGIVLKDLIYI